jgi:hypothetical protein
MEMFWRRTLDGWEDMPLEAMTARERRLYATDAKWRAEYVISPKA